jgi:hypothetical protein
MTWHREQRPRLETLIKGTKPDPIVISSMADRAKVAREYAKISHAYRSGILTRDQFRQMITNLTGSAPAD